MSHEGHTPPRAHPRQRCVLIVALAPRQGKEVSRPERLHTDGWSGCLLRRNQPQSREFLEREWSLAPDRTPPQRERRNANQQRGGNCHRTRRECRRRRHTRTRPALSRQVASPEGRVAGGIAANAVDAEAGGALSRRRARAALGDSRVRGCCGRRVGRRRRVGGRVCAGVRRRAGRRVRVRRRVGRRVCGGVRGGARRRVGGRGGRPCASARAVTESKSGLCLTAQIGPNPTAVRNATGAIGCIAARAFDDTGPFVRTNRSAARTVDGERDTGSARTTAFTYTANPICRLNSYSEHCQEEGCPNVVVRAIRASHSAPASNPGGWTVGTRNPSLTKEGQRARRKGGDVRVTAASTRAA